MAAMFAATHPERTSALVLYEAMPRMSWAPNYNWPPRREEREEYLKNGGLLTWGGRLANRRARPKGLQQTRDFAGGLRVWSASPPAPVPLPGW